MSSEDLQWLESYLRHGYDPEAQGADDSASFFQSNPYFALPPPSSYTAAHNGPPGSHSYQYSNERSVRPTGPSTSETPYQTQYSRPHQAQPHHPPASTMAPPPGSHTEGSYRFPPSQGPKSFPSQSPKPPPSQEYRPGAPQLPKPVPIHQAGPPQGNKPDHPRLPRPVPAQASKPGPPPGYQPASSAAVHSMPSQPHTTTPTQTPVSSTLPPAQVLHSVVSPMDLMKTSNSAPPTLPPVPAQTPSSRPSPMPPVQASNTRPTPMIGPQTTNPRAASTFPTESSAFSRPTIPTIQTANSASPPYQPAQTTNSASQPTMHLNNVAGNGSEPGHDAKRRRIAPPATPGRKSGRPPMPTAKVPPGSLPAGGLAAYNYAPRTTGSTPGKSHLKARGDIVMPLREEDAAEKLSYDPTTIARDVLIAAGRHPTEETLNHHLLRLRDVFIHVDSSSDLSTFRWDLVDPLDARDPGPPQPRATAAPPPPRPAPRPVPSLPVQQNNTFLSRPPQPPQPPQRSGPQPGVYLPARPPLPTQQPTQQLTQVLHVSVPQVPQPVSRPYSGFFHSRPSVQHPPPASRAHPLSQARPPPLLSSHPPSQPNTPTPTVQVAAMTGRRPGRPPASSKAQQPVASPQIPYSVFACGWTDCQAQLHNMEVLKKHVFKVHVSQQLTCGWKGCSHSESLPAALLFKHVKKDHLDPVAWRLGDGPSVPGTVGNDAGASLGPWGIPDTARPVGEDSLIFPASSRSIHAFNKVHGNNTPQEKTREIFKAVQQLKEQIGVGLDPGGCELATPARNERVSNDEEVYEVVPAS
ncbi:hypothetical protein BO94DRAFT_542968 [Aspergillus sclerotioniger CBS 115572]|uniref:C2H2-type domain-containing protein n=1 Tax=Aspergillus sclerotioniger CBS 115572 TaxID=1450535 RepID=A0A317X851_9EURO|nr:hypothetical protein BO94DRAFT_542968 [Aspergillus sclerotioniger CBS 115572]PWY94699.1 hypothetical protein BO94DRAFT_542968 [Aspergillus sclerotioniger CBS 115572]